MFYLWPIDRCSNSRTSLCWQSVDPLIFYVSWKIVLVLGLFSSRKPCDSYPRTDRSRRTLAKNDLPSSGADVWLSREMGFPYIYIYCISISRVFWRFLTIFHDFGFYRFFCALSPGKSLFFDVFWKSIPSLRYSHFLTFLKSVPFKEMGFSFLSIFYLFGRFF